MNYSISRCYQNSNERQIFGKYTSLAKLLSNLNLEQLNSIINCPEFDRQILGKMLQLATENYIQKLLKESSEWEEKINKAKANDKKTQYAYSSNLEENTSKFYVSVQNPEVKNTIEFESFVPCEFEPLLAVSLLNFERAVQTIVSLFPRQSRPLSQFETGNFSDHHTMDKYTRRCFQVFRDKIFHQELMNTQNIVTSFLQSYKNLDGKMKHVDCSAKEVILERFLSKSLSKSLMSFTVISLQYTLYLIKLHENDLPIEFKSAYASNMGQKIFTNFDHTLNVCLSNASRCFNLTPVWKILNIETNASRVHSAINCLYTYVRNSVKVIIIFNNIFF